MSESLNEQATTCAREPAYKMLTHILGGESATQEVRYLLSPILGEGLTVLLVASQ